MNDAHQGSGVPEQDLPPPERFEDDQVMHLQRGQLVAETSRPANRTQRTRRSRTVGAPGLCRPRQPHGHLHLHRPAALTNRSDFAAFGAAAILAHPDWPRLLAIAGWAVAVIVG